VFQFAWYPKGGDAILTKRDLRGLNRQKTKESGTNDRIGQTTEQDKRQNGTNDRIGQTTEQDKRQNRTNERVWNVISNKRRITAQIQTLSEQQQILSTRFHNLAAYQQVL
jgi:hypothetical protein